MKIEIVSAKPWHAGQMMRRLRAAHRDAAAAIGIGHRDLADAMAESRYARACLLDGRLVALWGTAAPLASSSAFVWVALSEEAARHPRQLLEITRRELAAMIEGRAELTTTLVPADEAAAAFARHLGFSVDWPPAFEGLLRLRWRPGEQRPRRRDCEAKPFLICTAGRSRTHWLSALLTYADWTCHHEVAIRLRELADIDRFFARPRTGSVETAAAPGWRLLRHRLPEVRLVVVRRPVDDIVESMLAIGTGGRGRFDMERLRRTIAYEARLLDDIARETGALAVDFADLVHEQAVRAIFEHCLPYAFDRGWWQTIRDRNIQGDMGSFFDYYFQHRDGVERFKSICKREMMRLARARILKKGAA